MNQSLAKVINCSEVMPGVYLIWLESPQIASEAKPGQFVMVRCGKDTLLRRPLGIHRVDKTKLALLFTVVGKGTSWLSQRQAGENIDLLGALGNGFSIQPGAKSLLLVAGGIGIAPLYFLAEEAGRKGLSVTLLMGAQTASQLTIQPPLPAETIYATEDGTLGRKGMITECLPDYIIKADQVFACGPAPMYRNMAAHCPQLKGKPVQISLEMRMGCGLGVCYSCTVKTKNGLKQVCKDGPVFNLDDILWEELTG